VYTPLLHRVEGHPAADRLDPSLWADRDRVDPVMLSLPFSDGPGACPGRNLVLTVAGATLAAFHRRGPLAYLGGGIRPERPLPGTLSPFHLAVSVG
jgi:cytochrome P450